MKITNKIMGIAFAALSVWLLVMVIAAKVSIRNNTDREAVVIEASQLIG